MKTCITCGMPLEGEHEKDCGIETVDGLVCKFDSENGKIKSGQAIFEGGVTFFAQACADGDKALAERLTRTNMNSLPYWQAHPFEELKGEKASQEEFQKAMAKLAE